MEGVEVVLLKLHPVRGHEVQASWTARGGLHLRNTSRRDALEQEGNVNQPARRVLVLALVVQLVCFLAVDLPVVGLNHALGVGFGW